LTKRLPNDPPSPSGVFSLDESVKHYLRLSGGGDYELDIDLRRIRQVCKSALKKITPLATKKGRKADLNFHLFVESLFHVARDCGARITLPSGQIKEKYGPEQRTAFFAFVRTTLDIAIEKGSAAIEQADLSEAEKEGALEALRKADKEDGALLEFLRSARKRTKADPEGGHGPEGQPGTS
jgi:hypothetical protein